jgi:hypothetical protein
LISSLPEHIFFGRHCPIETRVFINEVNEAGNVYSGRAASDRLLHDTGFSLLIKLAGKRGLAALSSAVVCRPIEVGRPEVKLAGNGRRSSDVRITEN